ncbi:hypothetical protein ACHAWF_002032 [Thalassiosira exigua]
MFAFLRDLWSFAEQIVPNPVGLLLPYRFAPADLPERSTGYDESNGGSGVLVTFDVLSYNVNHEAARDPDRRRRVLRAIASSGADVALLQETNQAWEELLRGDAELASRYTDANFRHPGVLDRPAGGIAVLSQHPLVDARTLDFAKDVDGSVFPALAARVVMPIRNDGAGAGTKESHVAINLANVHLRPPVELDGSAWFDTARTTEPIRVKEAKELIKRVSSADEDGPSRGEGLPLNLIAGDFNEGDDAEALAHLASLGYVDALQRHVPKRKETHTWPFMRNMFTLRKRLDHILWKDGPLTDSIGKDGVSGGGVKLKLQCIGCGVLTGFEDGVSDHQPVLARFVIVKG